MISKRKLIFAGLFFCIFYLFFIKNNVYNVLINNFDETEIYEFDTGDDIMASLNRYRLNFKVMGYVSGDAQLVIYKTRIKKDSPDHIINLDGGVFSGSRMPYYSGNVIITIESEEEVSGFLFVSVSD